jgi:hypothetical protein
MRLLSSTRHAPPARKRVEEKRSRGRGVALRTSAAARIACAAGADALGAQASPRPTADAVFCESSVNAGCVRGGYTLRKSQSTRTAAGGCATQLRSALAPRRRGAASSQQLHAQLVCASKCTRWGLAHCSPGVAQGVHYVATDVAHFCGARRDAAHPHARRARPCGRRSVVRRAAGRARACCVSQRPECRVTSHIELALTLTPRETRVVSLGSC